MHKRPSYPPVNPYRLAAEGLAFYANVLSGLDPRKLTDTLRAEPSGEHGNLRQLALVLAGAAIPPEVPPAPITSEP